MIKITPYQINPYNRPKSYKQNRIAFSSNQLDEKVQRPTIFSLIKVQKSSFPRIKNDNLLKSLNQLNYLKFDKKDISQIQALGVVLPFQSGKAAVDYIKKSNIEIKFDKLESENIHAQYDFDNGCIKINEIYKNSQNPAEILAISEAILHEVGHAKDGDGSSSIQEEIDCLALNAIAHRSIIKNSPNIFSDSDTLIVKDGVCVYSDLFFGDDKTKNKLINRINEKYGDLPVGDFNHPPSKMAFDIKKL